MDIKPMPTRLQAIPSWQLRLQNKIKNLRKQVSRLSERSNHSLERPKREATIEALESAKQQLVALSARLKWYTKKRDNKRMNKLFINNPSRVLNFEVASICFPEEICFKQAKSQGDCCYNYDTFLLQCGLTVCRGGEVLLIGPIYSETTTFVPLNFEVASICFPEEICFKQAKSQGDCCYNYDTFLLQCGLTVCKGGEVLLVGPLYSETTTFVPEDWKTYAVVFVPFAVTIVVILSILGAAVVCYKKCNCPLKNRPTHTTNDLRCEGNNRVSNRRQYEGRRHSSPRMISERRLSIELLDAAGHDDSSVEIHLMPLGADAPHNHAEPPSYNEVVDTSSHVTPVNNMQSETSDDQLPSYSTVMQQGLMNISSIV
ncbi:uncharacterized protein [Watersipora subatra]|uniref:uncharacterized protein n=1 Tax=Watersipora subatra TaxID=2589382 RepID=UPI00355AD954